MRLNAQAGRVEGMNPDAPHNPTTLHVHPNTCDLGKMWQKIQAIHGSRA